MTDEFNVNDSGRPQAADEGMDLRRAATVRATIASRVQGRAGLLAAAALVVVVAGVAGAALELHVTRPARSGVGAPGPEPAARLSAAMAFDGTGVMLFGGNDGRRSLGDTWRWDGSRWNGLHPAHAPRAREGATAVYDPATKTVLLIGGTTVMTGGPIEGTQDGNPNSSTRPYCAAMRPPDDVSHQQGASPPGIGLPVAPDECTQIIERTAEVWIWNGVDWHAGASLDASLHVTGATYSPDFRAVVIAASSDGRPQPAMPRNDCPPPPPVDPAKGSPGVEMPVPPVETSNPTPNSTPWRCSFAVPRRVVVRGDGEHWTVTDSPVPGEGLRYIAFDPASHRLLGFAQENSCGPTAIDDRALGGESGKSEPVRGGAPAPSAGITFEQARCLGSVGGDPPNSLSPTRCCRSPVYAFVGGGWALQGTIERDAGAPIATAGSRGLVALGAPGETLTWEGDRWRSRRPASVPPVRLGYALAADGAGRVLAFGGQVTQVNSSKSERPMVVGDLWIWDGQTWTHLAGASPSPATPAAPKVSDPVP